MTSIDWRPQLVAPTDTLRQIVAHYRQVAENSTSVLWLSDPNSGAIHYVNPAYEVVYERSSESLIEDPRSFLELVHPDDRDRVFEGFRDQQSGVTELEYRLIRSTGEIRWVHSRTFLVRDVRGREQCLGGLSEDITEERRSAMIQANHKEVLEQLVTGHALTQILETVLSGIEEHFSGICCSAALADERREVLTLFAGPSLPREFVARAPSVPIAEGWGVGSTAAYRNDRVVVTDVSDSAISGDLAELYLLAGFCACASQPVQSADGGVLGTIAIYYRERREPTPIEARFLEIAARIAAVAIERKRQEIALRESEARHRLLAGHATDIISRQRPDRTLLDVSIAVRRQLGYSPSELIDRDLFELCHPDDLNRVNSTLHELSIAPTTCTMTFRLLDKYGAYVWFESACRSIFADGFPQEIVAVSRNITERREAEEEQRRLAEVVQQRQKLESLGVLAGGIAHDFNNLLVGILGNAELALEDVGDNELARESITEIEKSARRAAGLCRQLLAYSGRARFVVEPIHLTEIVQEMSQLVELSISKRVNLILNLDPSVPPIRADATQIRQIIMNLLTNASEATEDNGGTVTVSTGLETCERSIVGQSFLVGTLTAGDYIFVEVRDTGRGMDPETCERIFEPFFTTKFTGRGLGLAAVLGIVRGHHGAIDVKSEKGVGTTFTVYFPRGKEQLPIAAPKNRRAEQRIAVGQGNVVIADDEDQVRRVADRMFSNFGFCTHLANNGVEALERIEALGRPELVVLDLTMPVLDGVATYRELRRRWPDLPVLLASGYHDEAIGDTIADDRHARFVSKPFSVATLRDTLSGLLVS